MNDSTRIPTFNTLMFPALDHGNGEWYAGRINKQPPNEDSVEAAVSSAPRDSKMYGGVLQRVK